MLCFLYGIVKQEILCQFFFLSVLLSPHSLSSWVMFYHYFTIHFHQVCIYKMMLFNLNRTLGHAIKGILHLH